MVVRAFWLKSAARCEASGGVLKELIKLGSAIPAWPWPKVGYLLALGLLYKGVVNFDQALLLTLLAIIIDRIGTRKSGVSADPNSKKG
jgi:hypothetical protein